MKLVDMTCPKCGASLQPDIDKRKAVCEYCGYQTLIEREDTIEETRAKAQAESYGYHKGRLKAEAEAKAARKGKYRGVIVTVIVIGAILLLALISAALQQLTKPQINPFDYIEVSFQGSDGKGEVILETTNVSEDIDINRVEFDISKDDWLLQGETITIQASSDDYQLLENTKTYIVEGLDEYLKDLENIPEEALEVIHVKAEAALKLNLESSKDSGAFVDMRPVKMFLTTDGKQSNCLYDVFEVRFATDAGEKTYYVMAYFNDVIVRNGEQVSVSMSGGMYQGHITQVQGWLHIMAYDSLEEIRAELLTSQDSYMELKELDFVVEEVEQPEVLSRIVKETYSNNDGELRQYNVWEYNEYGNQIAFINHDRDDSIVSQNEYEYDANGNLTKELIHVREKLWLTLLYEYDENGNRTKATSYYSDGSLKQYVEYEYDDNGRKIKELCYDSESVLTQYIDYFYNDADKVTERLGYLSDGVTMSCRNLYEYDEAGNLVKDIDFKPNGNIRIQTLYEYDANGNQIKEIVCDADGNESYHYENEFDQNGNRMKTVFYDVDGNPSIRQECEYIEMTVSDGKNH